MLCEICQKNEATVHFKQEIEGEGKEMNVCEACAQKKGFDVHSPLALTDFLFGIGDKKPKKAENEDQACAVCRMKLKDFRKTSRLGCPSCYETFRDALDPYVAAMHSGPSHVGKVPKGEKVRYEILAKQKKLEAAIASESFEDAAKLRDAIRELKETGDGA